jgi:hypothetical protein
MSAYDFSFKVRHGRRSVWIASSYAALASCKDAGGVFGASCSACSLAWGYDQVPTNLDRKIAAVR